MIHTPLLIIVLCILLILSLAFNIRCKLHMRKLKQYVGNLKKRDPLTGLLNRIPFRHEVKKSITAAQKTKQTFALILLDVDFLEKINTQYGRVAGDAILKQVAKRLHEIIKENTVIGRVGDDEFGLLLEQITTDNQAEKWMRKLIHLLRIPYSINEQEIYASVSAGVVIFPHNGNNIHELMANAHAAITTAKSQHRGDYYFLKKNIFEKEQLEAELQFALRQAIEHNQFELYYQPQFRLDNKQFIGMECLLRWKKSNGEMISPAIFIPLAEKIGILYSITEWVLLAAIQQIAAWKSVKLNGFRVAINVSLEKFETEKFLEYLNDKMTFYRVLPSNLEFEITEHIVSELITESENQLNKISQTGIQLAIDDFGTGYSSLDRLCTLPIQTLKIDQSFVRGMFTDQKNKSIVEAIINLGRSLGFHVLAEGIETEEQLQFLRDKQCEYGQGYLYSKPLNTQDATAFLQRHIMRAS